VYTAEWEIASITGAQTVMYLESPSSKCIEILAASLTNMDNDNAESLEAGLLYSDGTTGTGIGSGVTPQTHELGDAASTALVTADLSSDPTTLSTTFYDKQGFVNLAGYRYDPIPEERPVVSPSRGVALKLLAAPGTAFKATCQIVFREIG
jgi:hypothetical protein